MPNKLEKTPVTSGSGSGGGGSGSGGGGGSSGGSAGGTPPQPGTPCFDVITRRIKELWPLRIVVYDALGGYWKVLDPAGDTAWIKVTGTCSNGYVELSYVTVGSGSAASTPSR